MILNKSFNASFREVSLQRSRRDNNFPSGTPALGLPMLGANVGKGEEEARTLVGDRGLVGELGLLGDLGLFRTQLSSLRFSDTPHEFIQNHEFIQVTSSYRFFIFTKYAFKIGNFKLHFVSSLTYKILLI